MNQDLLNRLNRALDQEDTKSFLALLGEAVRATGSITAFAKKSGVGRVQLHRLLFSGKGNPTLRTLLKLFHGVGQRVTVELVDKDETA
jgi:probable addiction module antidote protein